MILATPPPFLPLPSADSLPTPDGEVSTGAQVARSYLDRIRAEVRQRHDAGAGGLAVVAAYTEAIDRLVRYLYDNATVHYLARNPRIEPRCAVIAQGGYGRAELNPYSDIDLLFLYPWKISPYVETVAEVMLYALWDAGLQCGHALRNMRECGRLAARDLKVKTALLDSRFLCGDEPLYAEFEKVVFEELWSQSQTGFFKEKLAENVSRHARAGDSVYLLQPQLKEGQGGLRDLHTALWMANVKFKVRTMRALVARGVLTEGDFEELERAVDFVWRVRNALHLATDSHQDQLTFDMQERLAPALGFGEGRPGSEAFMRTYFQHATTINRVSEAIIGRCVQQPAPYHGTPPRVRRIRDGMRIQGRTLAVSGPEVFTTSPAALVLVFTEAQRHGATLSPPTRDLIREAAPLLERVNASPDVAAAFLEIVRAKGHIYETLAEMHKLGVLKWIVPEFAHLECLIAHDPFHIYTVDHHSLMGVRELERLRTGEFSRTLPHLTQVVQELPQFELLVLGMLFHDIGKGEGHDHDSRGAAMARAICTRLGLNEDETASVEFLAQHHLLMSHLAQRRDIHDDQLVTDFCRTVGSVENLQRLYVLTYADMRAVGPNVWTNWRDSLLMELYTRAREFFETGAYQAEDRAARAERIRARVAAAAGPDEAAVRSRIGTMPDPYVLSTPEATIAAHMHLRERFAAREASGERPAVTIQVSPSPERGFSEIAICTRDRPGLFAMLSGVLAAHGLNILAARISTSSDGIALDAFRLSQLALDSADEERWERIEGTLRGVLDGRIEVEELVARSRRPSILQRPRRRVPTTIEIDNDVSHSHTVLDVYTGDRVGLLFTITNCLYHLWLEIHVAKITTMVDQVLDVFYVTDNEGRKIEDPERLERIRQELTAALEGPPAAVAAARAAGT